jgi:predicted O-linked N-acetylglucosamine transferase (SPINDLY family)
LQNPLLQNALRAHEAGNFPEAARLYADALKAEPQNYFALYLFGVLHAQAGSHAQALRLFDEALRLNPRFPEAHHQRGNTLLNSGRLAEALQSLDQAIVLDKETPDLLNAKGVALTQLGRTEEAIACYRRALALKPGFAVVLNNYGNALLEAQRYGEAVALYDRALATNPSYVDALQNRGTALYFLGRYPEALAGFDRVLSLAPNFPNAEFHRGLALAALGHHEAALHSYERALRLTPRDAVILHHRAGVLLSLGYLPEALAAYEDAIAANPAATECLINMAIVLSRLGRHAEALAGFDRALAISPGHIDALYNRANLLSVMRRYPEAVTDCERVLAAQPNYPYARGVLIHSKLNACDWLDLADERERISHGLARGDRVLNPQQNIPVADAPEDQLRCAQLWVERECPPAAAPLWNGAVYKHERIRVAYLSADYFTHATGFLMAGLFEAHDRARFEIHGVDFGPDDRSALRQRLLDAFEYFHDVRPLDDKAAAQLLRAREIDIAVDLKGYTENARTGIFAFRPSPVQVAYLGFPGTMGAPYIDYILADGTLVGDGDERFYSEEIVRLPHSYQCNDAKRAIGTTGTRAAAGLPENAFVFCCFNANYKTTPEIFDVWMRLLRKVEGSVLWLLETHGAATGNLKAEAERRGVAADRLIFAERAPLADHLARHRLADLALDTLPYNAHTTASDALWTGLPFVTLRGRCFAARVGASLLRAMDLPELVTGNLEAYEACALQLAMDRSALAAVKAKLLAHRESTPLFDTARFARDLETAYATMWERTQRGLRPAGFRVPG